jgi:hypothetical protein
MHLTDTEIDALRATIGVHAMRIFCPPPKIFNGYLEAASYSIWLDSHADFVNLFSVKVDENENDIRIAAERNTAPRDFRNEANGLIGCSDIFQNNKGDSYIRRVGIYRSNIRGFDSGLIFDLGNGGGFELYAGDVSDEVRYYWSSNGNGIRKTHSLRLEIT